MRALRLLAATVAALALLVPAARADDQIPMKVTFEANGNWTIDRHDVSPDDCGDISTHGTGTLAWTATWNTQLPLGKGGVGDQSVAGTLDGDAIGPYAATITYNSANPNCPKSDSCSRPMIRGGGPPPQLAIGGGADEFTVDAHPLQDLLEAAAAACVYGAHDIGAVMNAFMPDALNAHAVVPLTGLEAAVNAHKPYTAIVQGGTGVPADCHPQSAAFDTANQTCQQSLSWQGSLKIEPGGCLTIQSAKEPGSDQELTQDQRNAVGIGSGSLGAGSSIHAPAGQFPHGVVMTMSDGSTLRLEPGAEGKVESCSFRGEQPSTIRLVAGTIWAKVLHALGGDRFEVMTDRANAGVRGTAYWVHEDRHGVTFHLINGKIVVSNTKGHIYSRVMRPGQTVFVATARSKPVLLHHAPAQPPEEIGRR